MRASKGSTIKRPDTSRPENGVSNLRPRGKKTVGNRKLLENPMDWDKACLNPKCTLKHRIKGCKISSKERRKELLDEDFGSKKAASKAVKCAKDRAPNSDEGHLTVLLE